MHYKDAHCSISTDMAEKTLFLIKHKNIREKYSKQRGCGSAEANGNRIDTTVLTVLIFDTSLALVYPLKLQDDREMLWCNNYVHGL